MRELPTLVLVNQTSKKIRCSFDAFFTSVEPDGLGPQERHLLFYLADHSDATSADLQSLQGRSKSSISESLSLLAEKGYIEYVVCEQDRREKRILLTEQGHAFLKNAEQSLKKFDSIMLEGLSAEEEKALRAALEKICANAERSKNGQQ